MGSLESNLYKTPTTKEKTTATCKWCGNQYDLQKRQEERESKLKSHAENYCCNQCWIEADKADCCG